MCRNPRTCPVEGQKGGRLAEKGTVAFSDGILDQGAKKEGQKKKNVRRGGRGHLTRRIYDRPGDGLRKGTRGAGGLGQLRKGKTPSERRGGLGAT